MDTTDTTVWEKNRSTGQENALLKAHLRLTARDSPNIIWLFIFGKAEAGTT